MTASPTNLSDEAIDDFDAILARSFDRFGTAQAAAMRDRLMAKFARIADGTALGRTHPGLPFERPIRSVLVKPFLIFFDAETRVVTRIVDGRRDLPALFADDAG